MEESLEGDTISVIGRHASEAFRYIQEKRYSSLDQIGYTPELIDIFTGKKLVKTKWSPHPITGKPMEGLSNHKIWSPCEYWIYHEWRNEYGYGYALSPEQESWAKAWSDMKVLEFLISAGRGGGKSWLGALLALWSMAFLPPLWKGQYMVSLFAGAKAQTGTVYEEYIVPLITQARHIDKLLSRYDPTWEFATGKKRIGVKMIEMKFVNGGRLLVNPASIKAARSKHPDLLWVDEAVETEDVRKGQVIYSAISSLVAGRHMRRLGTSTVHRNPNGWFARRIRRAKRLMQNNVKTVFYTNLSKQGIGSKTWMSKEEQEKELAVKTSELGINIDAEFYGEIAMTTGDVFHQEALRGCFDNAEMPRLRKDPGWMRFAGHDPGFGSSYYGFVILQTDMRQVEVLFSEFWWRGRLNQIMETIAEKSYQYQVSHHACDAAATTTIQKLQELGFDVKGYSFNARPEGWEQMIYDERERFNAPLKKIGINFMNDLIDNRLYSCYGEAGAYKPYDVGSDSIEVYANQILQEQMLSYKEDPATGKPMKGDDDMIDAQTFGCLPIVLDQAMHGRVRWAGQIS